MDSSSTGRNVQATIFGPTTQELCLFNQIRELFTTHAGDRETQLQEELSSSAGTCVPSR